MQKQEKPAQYKTTIFSNNWHEWLVLAMSWLSIPLGEHFSKNFKPHAGIHPNAEHLETINSSINSPIPVYFPAKHASLREV